MGDWIISGEYEPYTFGDCSNDVPVVEIDVPCSEVSKGVWSKAIEVRGPDAVKHARLIAAAPCLCEYLDWALAEIEGRTRYSPDFYSAKEQRDSAMQKAGAALAKARGEA